MSSSGSGSVAPSSPKRARGSVGEVQEMTGIVTSHLFQRLTQLEVRVTDAERTVKRQSSEIAVLQEELTTVKNRLIMSEGRHRALEARATAVELVLPMDRQAGGVPGYRADADEAEEDIWGYRPEEL